MSKFQRKLTGSSDQETDSIRIIGTLLLKDLSTEFWKPDRDFCISKSINVRQSWVYHPLISFRAKILFTYSNSSWISSSRPPPYPYKNLCILKIQRSEWVKCCWDAKWMLCFFKRRGVNGDLKGFSDTDFMCGMCILRIRIRRVRSINISTYFCSSSEF